jgi:capsid protein
LYRTIVFCNSENTFFLKELGDIGSSKPTIVALGNATHKILLRNICMGLGIPYSFAVDPSAMSGPTARLEMQQAGRTFNRYQKLLNDKVLNPIKNIVIADGVARGMISGNGTKTTKGIFNFGANVSIDLGRESMANIAEFKAGLTTASSIYAEKGLDVEAAFRARAIETKMIQDLAIGVRVLREVKRRRHLAVAAYRTAACGD